MNLQPFKTLPFYIKAACVLFVLMALGYLTILGKEIISPLIFSCLFSILLLPLATKLEKKLKLPRSVASLVSVLILLAGIALLLYVIGSQVSGLVSDWPQFQSQLEKSLKTFQLWISHTFHINVHKQLDYVHSATKEIMASGTTVVGATVLSISSLLLFFVFTFIYTFFFLLYRRLILQFLIAVFLEENKSVVHGVAEEVQYIIRKYIVGLLIEMGIVAAIVCTAFWALGIKHAILLGILTGVLNIIPYIGIFTALLLSVIITFATAAATGKVVIVIVIVVATHLIDSNVFFPFIVGSKVRINALITVLGVVVGEMIWGIQGMFLSIPVIAVLKIIFDRVESLKPWGVLLGDEEYKPTRFTARLQTRRTKK